jgi:cytoskeletal protein CcmA (bactofilin family)
MGIFGRDDRTDDGRPAPAESQSGQRRVPQAGSSLTLIAKTSHVEGEIKGAGDVRIEGTLNGKLDCSSSVTVAEGGTVDAELRAETISISGKVRGDIQARQKIELTPTAEVEGDITSPRILIREGATFEGQVCMNGKKGGSAPGAAKTDDKSAKAEKK